MWTTTAFRFEGHAPSLDPSLLPITYVTKGHTVELCPTALHVERVGHGNPPHFGAATVRDERDPAGRGRRDRTGSATRRSSAPRRSAEEMARVAEQLYELVCAQPGESMMRFAEQTGLRTRDLHRPMSKLKAEGRVRSVGQRHLTRYFPSVGRRSRDS